MFYTDTALNGNSPALMLAHSFFGPERLLFGTDAPHDHLMGDLSIHETIASVERMEINPSEKKLVFAENAKRLLHLSV